MLRKPDSHTVFALRTFLPVLGSAFALQDSRSSPAASIARAWVEKVAIGALLAVRRFKSRPKTDRDDPNTGTDRPLCLLRVRAGSTMDDVATRPASGPMS